MLEFNVRRGCMTAMDTPFNPDGSIDWLGLTKNTIFQIQQGVIGLVPVGTTGESPTLSPMSHVVVAGRVTQLAGGNCHVLVGAGSNSTEEMFQYGEAGLAFGCSGLLLVDCYYNKPSSLELRENYYKLAAERFPTLVICPYVIPGRTGCALCVEDLALLAHQYSNVRMVKEATGDFDRMRYTRRATPEWFYIFSGDDDKTLRMILDPDIRADGVISVMSNIAPAAVQKMCQKAFAGEIKEAQEIEKALAPLFQLVTVSGKRIEEIPRIGLVTIEDKFPNPDSVKTMMQGLGMPADIRRPPLGKMNQEAVPKVRSALREVWDNNPWVLKPIEDFYQVDITNRLANDEIWAAISWKGNN